MSDVTTFIPKDFVRVVVHENGRGDWLAEIFANKGRGLFYLKCGEKAFGPLKLHELQAIADATSDIRWAIRNGFSNVIADKD